MMRCPHIARRQGTIGTRTMVPAHSGAWGLQVPGACMLHVSHADLDDPRGGARQHTLRLRHLPPESCSQPVSFSLNMSRSVALTRDAKESDTTALLHA